MLFKEKLTAHINQDYVENSNNLLAHVSTMAASIIHASTHYQICIFYDQIFGQLKVFKNMINLDVFRQGAIIRFPQTASVICAKFIFLGFLSNLVSSELSSSSVHSLVAIVLYRQKNFT